MNFGAPSANTPDNQKEIVAVFSANLAQVAGAYPLFTASGGDVLITSIDYYVTVAAVGLTSVSIATNDTTPVTLLTSVLLVNLTIGLNLTRFTAGALLLSGKLANYTIVGTGSAGTIKCAVKYRPTVQGAIIS